MTRLLASLLVALLVTATLSMPVEAAGKPGTIQQVTAELLYTGGAPNICTYRVTLTFNAPKKEGYYAKVWLYQTDPWIGSVGNAGYLLSISPTSGSGYVDMTYTFSSLTYQYFVYLYKPGHTTGTYITISDVATSAWTQTNPCKAGTVSTYYR